MNFVSKGSIVIVALVSMFVSCLNIKQDVSLVSKNDSLFTFDYADQKLIVDAHGGRIVSFQMDHIETLGPGGSTFWVSPQSYWSWPPLKQHHEEVYTTQISGDTLILKSEKDDLLHLQIVKLIYSNPKDTSFTIRYGILNSGDSLINIAPWENTRTFKNALLFYPKGSTDSMASNPVFGKLGLTKSHGINWFSYAPSRVKQKSMGKLFADGAEGWICGANNGLILIKQFQNIYPDEQAPGEGEIEIFADNENSFLEMEQQGPMTKLSPGQTVWWEVKWILRKVPMGVEVREGNRELLNFVKNTLHEKMLN